VCGNDDFGKYPATLRVVPRHFVKYGAATPAARGAAPAVPATNRVSITVNA
jgi:hypothetical protein